MEISWVDFREEDKKRVLDVLELWKEPGAVDELGVGVIRDYFADKLFPGTSTRHNKAKYFLLTPYIFKSLENKLPDNVDDCIKMLNHAEMECSKKLQDDINNNKGSDLVSYKGGITGEDILKTYNGKRWVKVGPKDIYWGALRKYEIFKQPNLSLYGYLREVIEAKKLKNNYTFLKKETSEQEALGDDGNVAPNYNVNNYWNLPENAYENWVNNSYSVKLSKDEAEFLKERITTTQGNSLLAECLKSEERIKDFANVLKEQKDSELFDHLEGLIQKWELPDEVKEQYYIAKCVSDFIYCVQIRFNCIIKNNKTNKEKWENYKKTIPEILNNEYLELLFISAPDNELGNIVYRNRILKQYLPELRRIMSEQLENEDFEDNLDKLIINWEKANKRDRAKLKEKDETDEDDNSEEIWHGLDKLNYRVRNAQNLVTQIWEGLI